MKTKCANHFHNILSTHIKRNEVFASVDWKTNHSVLNERTKRKEKKLLRIQTKYFSFFVLIIFSLRLGQFHLLFGAVESDWINESHRTRCSIVSIDQSWNCREGFQWQVSCDRVFAITEINRQNFVYLTMFSRSVNQNEVDSRELRLKIRVFLLFSWLRSVYNLFFGGKRIKVQCSLSLCWCVDVRLVFTFFFFAIFFPLRRRFDWTVSWALPPSSRVRYKKIFRQMTRSWNDKTNVVVVCVESFNVNNRLRSKILTRGRKIRWSQIEKKKRQRKEKLIKIENERINV